jgi:hypothetical protein
MTNTKKIVDGILSSVGIEPIDLRGETEELDNIIGVGDEMAIEELNA